jgi:hypothetical protein
MGYTTTFKGEFRLNKSLRPEHKAYLHRFSEMVHLPLKEDMLQSLSDPLRLIVGLPVGKYGMYFTGLIEGQFSSLEDGLSAYSGGPAEQFVDPEKDLFQSFPSHYCKWIPTTDGCGIQWNRVEKFYGYVGWLRFLLDHFLIPWGYELSGTVFWQGEQGEHGTITVENQQVIATRRGCSLLPRVPSSDEQEEIHIYWMAVGSVSTAARQALHDADCLVIDLHQKPPVVLVGLRYDINYYKRYGYDDLAVKTTEGIALHRLGLDLAHDISWSYAGALSNMAWFCGGKARTSR